MAFLPRSQVDIRPVRDVTPLMGVPQPFQILKMDRRRGNIVVSRRTVLEETRAEARSELVANLEEGQVIDGVVKNITEYGAFVDLGGIDGLLHVTDMAWRRVNHPSEVVNIGQTVKVKIVKIDHETHRISLGIKQLLADPWEGIAGRYPVNSRFAGRVTNITDYGAFVELEPGIEGLIHVSEMSWTKKNVHPGKIVSTSQEVEVQILEVDPVKRRISLGLKQTLQNPWDAFAERHPPARWSRARSRTRPSSACSSAWKATSTAWCTSPTSTGTVPASRSSRSIKKGDVVKATVLDVDVDKERISLGIKQLAGDPFADAGEVKKGQVVTCEVIEVKDGGIDVKLVDPTSLPSSSAPNWRASGPTSGPSGSRRARRSMPASPVRPQGAPHHPLHQGPRNGRGEGGDRRIRLDQFGRVARRHPRRRPEEGRREEVTGTPLVPRRNGDARAVAPRGFACIRLGLPRLPSGS